MAQLAHASSTEETGEAGNDSPKKEFLCTHSFHIDEIESRFEAKEEFKSLPFFCRQDPLSPTFVVRVRFGTKIEDKLAVHAKSVTSHVELVSFNVNLYDNEWSEIDSNKSINRLRPVLLKKSYFGSNKYFDREDYETEPGVHFVVEIKYKSSQADHSAPPCNVDDRFRNDFLRCLDSEEDADITFVVKEEKIKAHRLVLSTRCPYFKAMLASGMDESVTNEVNIPDIEPEVFKELLKFLYSGIQPEYDERISAGLLVVADKYGIDDLKKICESTLAVHLDRGNVIELLLIAKSYNCPTLLNKALLTSRSYLPTFKKAELNKLKACPTLLINLLTLGFNIQ